MRGARVRAREAFVHVCLASAPQLGPLQCGEVTVIRLDPAALMPECALVGSIAQVEYEREEVVTDLRRLNHQSCSGLANDHSSNDICTRGLLSWETCVKKGLLPHPLLNL